MGALHSIHHDGGLSADDRLAALEEENAALRERLDRVEFVLRTIGSAGAFVDHPPTS